MSSVNPFQSEGVKTIPLLNLYTEVFLKSLIHTIKFSLKETLLP